MASNKADVKDARKRGEFALKGFSRSKVSKAINTMAADATAADKASDSKAMAALELVGLAEQFADRNLQDDVGAPVDVIAKGWQAELKSVALELAVAGCRFAELKEGKEGEAATAKLTGYGANVASIARGVIEFGIHLDCLPDGVEGIEGGTAAESYRDVRKVVEAKRAEARRKSDPEAAALADAVATMREAGKKLADAVVETGDIALVTALTETFGAMLVSHEAAIAEQDATEAEAESKAAA